jgi:predicted acetyltransferase
MMVIMSFEIREPRTADEAEQSRRLSHEAFGMPDQQPTEPAALTSPGAVTWAAFDGDRMAARMTDRDYDSWFGGKLVRTSGIGGVTVAMEDRGRGLLRPLFERLFAGAVERGAVLSTLYPSASGIYRRLGYEVIGTAEDARLPIAALARVRRPSTVRTRRARVGDAPAIRSVYDRWAAAHNGPLSRRGASFPVADDELINHFTGVTVAETDAGVVGYMSWDRGQGFGQSAGVKVSDLLADTADGYRALLADLGSYGGLLGELSITTSGLDLVRHLLPASDWRTDENSPYMLKILDVCGALTARGYSLGLTTTLDFAVEGDPITGIDGRYRLTVDEGKASCERLGDHDRSAAPDSLPTFTPNGLAIAYAGSQSMVGIRATGGLTGPDADDDLWALTFAGRPVRIHDHF